MRNGFSDAQIVATEATAAHNIRLFVELREFESVALNEQSLRAALQIAADLSTVYNQHAADRRSGVRRW
jgi:hypothetical protein